MKVWLPVTLTPMSMRLRARFTDLSAEFRTVAQAIKLDLGMRVATVDYGSSDTQEDQPADFARQISTLSGSLSAFWRDLGPLRENVTVVVLSEFGRRLRANTSGGTDHGFGNAMMMMGGEFKGRRMLGAWPGLSNETLDDGADLAITTNYLHNPGEILSSQMPDFDPAIAFPEYTAEPRGIFDGYWGMTDIPLKLDRRVLKG